MGNRGLGYYWVKVADNWEVARWDGTTWQIFGGYENVCDEGLCEIGPRISAPNELGERNFTLTVSGLSESGLQSMLVESLTKALKSEDEE